jgi:hypothetical protein
MTDATDESALANALILARRLREIIGETQSDMGRMPIFVRPMAKRGFAKRTGRSFAEWDAFAGDLCARLQAGAERARTVHADSIRQLERLLDNYRTAPERAGRFMRDDDALRIVTERSRERERVVADTIQALRELGIG